MIYVPAALLALATALFLRPRGVHAESWAGNTPEQAQRFYPKDLAVLPTVLPPSQSNITTQFVPPGYTLASLQEKPFHVYDDEFYDIIGTNPTLTLIAETDGDPLFHEANAWYPPTDEMFFVQNAGPPAAGTGLYKSSLTLKISMKQAEQAAAKGLRNSTGIVDVITVNSSTAIINPNGATNYRNGLLVMGQGQGDNVPSAMYYLDPNPPYNATVILNNYFGRQFNSLNDVAINPRNKEIYFTDVTYGYLQSYRPTPGLPNQVYRFNEKTGAIAVVSDAENKPNGITFSPDGSYAYIADTGAALGFWGFNATFPATIYRYTVNDDGTFSNRMTFAYPSPGFPDGVHCDAKGNVYAGCGDGVQVWNPSGKLIGKIFLGETSANFQFAGKGRMVICAETRLFYASLKAEGAPITDYDYSEVS